MMPVPRNHDKHVYRPKSQQQKYNSYTHTKTQRIMSLNAIRQYNYVIVLTLEDHGCRQLAQQRTRKAISWVERMLPFLNKKFLLGYKRHCCFLQKAKTLVCLLTCTQAHTQCSSSDVSGFLSLALSPLPPSPFIHRNIRVKWKTHSLRLAPSDT